jgi:hypothetical protein
LIIWNGTNDINHNNGGNNLKKFIILMLVLCLSVLNLFAANNPNILINGHLGENLPASIILEVDSTVIEESGSVVSIVDDYNFTTNRSSLSIPVYVYVGYSSYSNSSNVIFGMEISTEGFKEKNTSGTLIGSPLDIDIQMYTQSLSTSDSLIIVNSSSSSSYNKNIFLDLASTPAVFDYSIAPGASINDANYKIWFTWGEKENVPAGQYGALINFAITSS